MFDDLYEEGVGAGLQGCDWLSAVQGRFLKCWQRSELASGWKAGLAERAWIERVNAEAAAERAAELTRDREDLEACAVPVGCDDEIPF